MLGNASEQSSSEPAPAMGPDHDEIRVDLVGDVSRHLRQPNSL